MIIQKITLNNWQGYYGSDHVFDFTGGNGYSSIIYGENSFGKSAFWESIEFALYGNVEMRRSKQDKPLIAPESADKPLLNTTSYSERNFDFSVDINFIHENSEYSLHRGYTLNKRKSTPSP